MLFSAISAKFIILFICRIIRKNPIINNIDISRLSCTYSHSIRTISTYSVKPTII
jgi:hypothetical protein